MRIALLAAVALLISVSAVVQVSRADGKEDELKKLQGIWKVVDEDLYGKSQMTDPERTMKIRIAGDLMMLFDRHDSLEYVYTLHNLNPSASPSAVDLTLKRDEKTMGEFPAVYKLDGVQMKGHTLDDVSSRMRGTAATSFCV